MKKLYLIATLVIVALLTISCSQNKKNADTTKASDPPASQVQPANQAGSAAPAFTLTDDQNHEVKLSDFSGKVIILDFWATWCPPCRAEIPDFIALQKQYGAKGLQVIGVSVDQKGWEVVTPFMQSQGINYPILMSNDGVYTAYQNLLPEEQRGGIPFTFIIDGKGIIKDKVVGARPREYFESSVKPLLGL
ncbi:MAG: TlpA disulfide reductase family protein [bacterium]|nr:TlpA disulfide reductase family protein [bacterium]